MSFEQLTKELKEIQESLLIFLEDESDGEEKYQDFLKVLRTSQITKSRQEIQLLLKLINQIGVNHRRNCNFIKKIEQVLEYLEDDIRKYFSNPEIFKIFEYNKRILLFLFELEIIIIDECIVSLITSDRYEQLNYSEYFLPEISPFLTKKFIDKYKNQNKILNYERFINKITTDFPSDFKDKRREGERELELYRIIRKNEIDEFISLINKLNLPFRSNIQKSIFETNIFLFRNSIEIIEYAAFFGSLDIVKYIHINGVDLEPNIWLYAIHSQNAELIKYLEDNNVPQPGNNYESILEESIKCHHNEISNYIIDNKIKEEELQHNIDNNVYKNLYRYSFLYYNFFFFPSNMKNKYVLFYFCVSNYYLFVKLYLQQKNIDINTKFIK